MRPVHAFPARLVRPDWARRMVSGLAELPEDTGTLPPVGPPDPMAYDEPVSALYVYEQSREDDHYTGVVCAVSVSAFVDGQVKGHEAVQAQRVDSLVRHHETTDAPPALVALLHRPGAAYQRVVEELSASEPLLDFGGPGGYRQRVWRVLEGAAGDELAAELSAAELYIADGHHRVAAALAVWEQDGRPGAADVLCVVHPMGGLRLAAFHRRVLGPVERGALVDLLAPTFTLEAVPGQPVPTPGSFGLYAAGRWHLVVPRVAGDLLDVEVLTTQVLEPLGKRVEISPAQTPVDELVRRCDSDEGVLFTLAPPPLGALTGLADAGAVMPPKTTYFAPKPCAGIFRRP